MCTVTETTRILRTIEVTLQQLPTFRFSKSLLMVKPLALKDIQPLEYTRTKISLEGHEKENRVVILLYHRHLVI